MSHHRAMPRSLMERCQARMPVPPIICPHSKQAKERAEGRAGTVPPRESTMPALRIASRPAAAPAGSVRLQRRVRSRASTGAVAGSAVRAPAVVILPGLGNEDGDYAALQKDLEALSMTTRVAKVARIDWARNAAGVVDPAYWAGNLCPTPTVNWCASDLSHSIPESCLYSVGCNQRTAISLTRFVRIRLLSQKTAPPVICPSRNALSVLFLLCYRIMCSSEGTLRGSRRPSTRRRPLQDRTRCTSSRTPQAAG